MIRPLIGIGRCDVVEALALAETDCLTDPSNADQRFTRNRIRNQLIPLLESRFNPKIRQVLNRLGAILQAENQCLEQQAADLLARALRQRQDQRIELDLAGITCCHPALQRRLLRQAIAAVKADLKRIGFVHVEAVRGLIHGMAGGSLHLPDRVLVRRRGAMVAISRENAPLRSGATPNFSLPDAG